MIKAQRFGAYSAPFVRKAVGVNETVEAAPGVTLFFGGVEMDWQGRIITTPDVLFGRPRIAGTRIGVDFVLDLLASGWNEAKILENYPHVKPDDLQALFAFVRDCLKEEDFVLRAKAASDAPA